MNNTKDWKEEFRKRGWSHWHSNSSQFRDLPESTKEEIIKFISQTLQQRDEQWVQKVIGLKDTLASDIATFHDTDTPKADLLKEYYEHVKSLLHIMELER